MTQLRYVITRPCLLEGSLTIAKYLRPLLPMELAGQALHLRDTQGRDYSVRMTSSGNTLIGMGSVYHALNLNVNDVLLIERVGNTEYLVQGIAKPYSRPQSGATYGSHLTELPHRRVVVNATPHVREVRLEQDYASYPASQPYSSNLEPAQPQWSPAAIPERSERLSYTPSSNQVPAYNDPLPTGAGAASLQGYSAQGQAPAVRVDSLRLEGGHLEAVGTEPEGRYEAGLPMAASGRGERIDMTQNYSPSVSGNVSLGNVSSGAALGLPESTETAPNKPSKIEAVRRDARIEVHLDNPSLATAPLGAAVATPASRPLSGAGRTEAQRPETRLSETLPATRITELRPSETQSRKVRTETRRAETERAETVRIQPQNLSQNPTQNATQGFPQTRVEGLDELTRPVAAVREKPEDVRQPARLADVLLRGTAAAPTDESAVSASADDLRRSGTERVPERGFAQWESSAAHVTQVSNVTPVARGQGERGQADTVGAQLEELAQLTGYHLSYLGGRENGPARLVADLGPYSYDVVLALSEAELRHPAFAQATYHALLTWEAEHLPGTPRFTREALTALLEHARMAPLTPVDLRGYWNTASFDLGSVASVAELVSAHLAQRGTFTFVLSTLAQQPAHSVIDPQRLAEKLGSGVNNAELRTILDTLSRPPFMALLPLPSGHYYLRAEVSVLLSELSSYAAGVARRLHGRSNPR